MKSYKKYSLLCKLTVEPKCHMAYFTDVPAMFLCIDRGNILSMEGKRAFGFHKKYINFCS